MKQASRQCREGMVLNFVTIDADGCFPWIFRAKLGLVRDFAGGIASGSGWGILFAWKYWPEALKEIETVGAWKESG